MSWIKLDDQWMDHPKIIRAGRDARDMWLASLTWCAKHLTDGVFPAELLPALAVAAGINVANCQELATVLVEVCLWESHDGSYLIHDYLEYNPSKEQVESNKKARSKAGRAGGLAKASKTPSKTLAKSKQNSAPSPSPIKDKSADALLPEEAQKPKRTPPEFSDPLWDVFHGIEPTQPTDPPPPDTTWLPADIIDLGSAFLAASKLPPPPDASTRGYWIKELRSMRLDDDLTQDDMRRAIRKMRDTGGIIKSPQSIRNVAIDIRAASAPPNFAETY